MYMYMEIKEVMHFRRSLFTKSEENGNFEVTVSYIVDLGGIAVVSIH